MDEVNILAPNSGRHGNATTNTEVITKWGANNRSFPRPHPHKLPNMEHGSLGQTGRLMTDWMNWVALLGRQV